VTAESGLIAFEQDQGTSSDIFTMTPSGGSLRQLTTWRGADFSPSWSPTGSIAFVSDRSGSFELYKMTTSGAAQRRLTRSSGVPKNNPDWAPDGRRLAFAGGRPRRADMYLVRPPSPRLTIVSRHHADDAAPAWSPSGTQLVFSSGRGGGRHLFLYTLESRKTIRLTAGAGADLDPAWAPDGRQVAFTRLDAAGNYDVWTLDIGSHAERRLTSGSAQDRDPTWSPDGSEIAFVTNREVARDYEIYVMQADGSNPRNVSHDPKAFDLAPDWSSASVRLPPRAFVSPPSRAPEIVHVTCEIGGGDRNDNLVGTDSADVICGGKGADTIHAEGGDDDVRGGPGDDEIWGGLGSDVIDGGAGNDALRGGPKDDRFYPGLGGRDDVNGGKGKLDICILCDPNDHVVNVESST